jgi:NADH-quinone oxidoreductase subunit A
MIENKILYSYVPIFIFITIATLISLIILVLPRLLANFKPQKAKLSSYECGFDPITESNTKFDIKFYLIAILFIIFDLEVAFLIPWAVRFKNIGTVGFWSMMFFIFILLIGFIYEWKKGALELN